MGEQDLRQLLIDKKQHAVVEFSNSNSEITESVFQSVCSLLNNEGGFFVIGAQDFGKVSGIKDIFIDNMLDKLTKTIQKDFTPTPSVTLEVLDIYRMKIICLDIPQTPEVYRYKNKVYDRQGNEVVDVSYTYSLIENVYLRKLNISSENIVLPFLRIGELEESSFRTMRKYIAASNPNHPWLNLTDEDILHAAGFWRKDPMNNKEGFVLAAVLLFGKEVTIQTYCPIIHRIDAIYRDIKYDDFLKPYSNYPETKYDDRDIIFSNLIDSYHRLMSFIERHTPARVVQLGSKSVDIRKKIFGELVTNLLAHREYTHKLPSKVSLFTDKIITENGNKPSLNGDTFETLEAETKNPLISKIFREMKWTGEPGSGKSNIRQYAVYYDRTYEVEIHNGDKFVSSLSFGNEGLDPGETTEAPVRLKEKAPEREIERVIKSYPTQRMYKGWPVYESKLYDACPDMDISYIEKAESILEACIRPRTIQDMMQLVKQSNRTRFRQNIIRPLLDEGLLAMRIPTKPSSPLQKYFTTEKGKALLDS